MKKLKSLIGILIFIFSVWLVFKGQKINSYFGLLIMVLGIGGILTELYLYNRKYQ